MEADSLQSYNRWMRETFFDHVNIPEDQIHIPKGNIPQDEIEEFCDEYERAIQAAGGIDLQILGIGRTGHIGFNEPGSPRNSLTRLVTLDPVTRRDAASDFFGEENVPLHALTIGVGTILSAKSIYLIVLGEHKAPIVRRAVEGEVSHDVTASFLQTHQHAVVVLDAAAAGELTAVRTPWLVGRVTWTPSLEKRAVIWLSQKCGKPLLKLDARDFVEHHLHGLVRERGAIETTRQRVFEQLLNGICPRPGGAEPQSIIVFSPHPDDDVISMGGTLITLADQGHDLHVAYMTSGNIAVFDEDAQRHIDYVREFQNLFKLHSEQSESLHQHLRNVIRSKKPGEPDDANILSVKALIRKTEATAAAQIAGVLPEKLHFLDLPFYQTGQVTKRPIGGQDVAIIVDLLRRLKPS